MEHSVIGYFTSWSIYGRRYYPRDIPGAGVTHLNYAFAMPTVEGTCDPVDPWADFQRPFPAQESVDSQADNPDDPNQRLFGNFNQLRKLKAAHPHLKLLISIGGWTRSAYFWHAAATPQSRTAFVRSCIDTFIKGNLPSGDWPPQAGGPGAAAGLFDGIDIDWMHPGADRGDGARYSSADRLKVTLLFQEFRGQLDALDRAYLLSAVLPGGRLRSTGSFQLAQVAQSLDWVNLLTYDFHGDWDQRTNFNSPFLAAPNDPTPSLDRATWNVSGTVDWYLASGVPAHKLVVGIPFYVRQYLRVPAENDGLYQPFNNSGLDANALQWDRTPTPTFHDLVDVVHILEPGAGPDAESQGRDGYTRYWSAGAGEPWLYHPAAVRFGEKTGVFFSYEDPRSIAQRISLIRERQLGGAMFWEISQDSDGHDLLNALAPLLGDAEAGTENPRYGPER